MVSSHAGGSGIFPMGWNGGPLPIHGSKVLLDDDGTTYMVSDTNDEIQFFAGGSEIAEFDETSIDLTSVLGLAAGAVDAPSLTRTGDLNTGFWFSAADTINASVAGAEVLEIDAEAVTIATGTDLIVLDQGWIGPTGAAGTYANANMTVGLTINQEAADNQAFALKSSDVAHSFTGIVETDTYFQLGKSEGAAGGIQIRSFKDADGGNESAMLLRAALGEAAPTSDTSSSRGLMEFNVEKTDGSTGTTALGTTENAFIWLNAFGARMILKGNGDMHITNTTLTALDDEDDIGLVRQFQHEASGGLGIAMSKWDDRLATNSDDLKRVGVISSEGDFVIQQRMNTLLGGAIWQQHTKHMSLADKVDSLVGELAITKKQLAALTT